MNHSPSMIAGVRIAALVVAVAALGVLTGYCLHIRALIDIRPGLQGMSVSTAIGLLAAAAAIIAETSQWRRWGGFCAAVTLLVGCGLVALHLALGADPISAPLAHGLFNFDLPAAGKTSLSTAACLAALGFAAVARDRPRVADTMACISLMIAAIAILGYAYGVHDLYAVPVFNTMALHTAVSLCLLSIASLLARPAQGVAQLVGSSGAGGQATRRQLAFTLLPPLAGALLIQATLIHRLGFAAAMAFLVVVTIVPLALLVLRDGQALEALEEERKRVIAMQASLALDLQRQLAIQEAELKCESADRAQAEQALYRSQRMEAIGKLTGGIAHDFNNLLMAIGGNLQLLTKHLSLEHPARNYADKARCAAERAAKVTGQLLAFSRSQKLDIRPVELDPVLGNARELLQGALGPAILIETQLAAPQAWASTDPAQLELAILNLAVNARDAMPHGGSLHLQSRLGRRAWTTKAADGTEVPEANFVFISVRDTGVGMSAEVIAQAVEPFFTTKERGKGSGLGLAQVYGFVRQCGGDLHIDSQLGSGTTIEIMLPVAQPPAQSATAARAPPVAAADERVDHRLLLVIDDDDSVRAVLVDALRGAGFTVIEASNGAEGLKLLDRHDPSAAIIDFLMPGINGAEVARQAQRRRPGLPIIFVSGYYDTMALNEIAGAVVLRKPIDLDRLQQTVRTMARSQQLH